MFKCSCKKDKNSSKRKYVDFSHLATSYQGEVLQLNKVTREAMGIYLCIASNGVPPSIQRKHSLIVLCK